MGTQIIKKARVTFVFRGYGDLILTDVALIWNKSATSYMVFGVMNAATEEHTMIPLEKISLVDKYTYYPGGGLKIIDKDGKEFKFSFKHKKDFIVIYEYLKQYKSKTAVSSGGGFCRFCGSRVSDCEAKFCSACGKEL